MDKNLLVEIFVDVGKENGYIATGYPVGKSRIITACHVLYPDGQQPISIEVRWYHQTDKAREWQSLDPQKCIVWEDHDTFDVALLDCKFPVTGNAQLSAKKPQDGADWASEGFPDAGKIDDNQREPVSMGGTTYSAADAMNRFELGINNPPEEGKLWKGASGSPVFVDGRIIGIIASFQKPFGGKRFKATPTWKLLAIPDFCAAVGYDVGRTERLSWARSELANHLRDSSTLPVLCGCLKQAGASAEILANTLLECPFDWVLTVLGEARRNLAKQKNSAGVQCVGELLNILLPSVFDQGTVASVLNQKNDFCYSVLNLPVATRTFAEIIMAGVDVRPTAFKSLTGDLPEGVYSLPEPPEGGIQQQGEAFIQSFHSHIIQKFTGPDVAHAKPEIKIKLAAAKLKHLATRLDDHYSHYYLYILPTSNDERIMYTNIIEKLQAAYPAMAFINLSADDNLLMQEYEQALPLADLLRG